MPAAAAKPLAYNKVVSGAKVRMLRFETMRLYPCGTNPTRLARDSERESPQETLTHCAKNKGHARQFLARHLPTRCNFHPLAIGIRTMASGLLKYKILGASRRCHHRSELPTL